MMDQRERALEAVGNFYALKSAEEILKSGISPRVNAFEFKDTHDPSVIKRDMAEVDKFNAKIEDHIAKLRPDERVQERKKIMISAAFETALAWGAEAYGWFGKNTMVVRTSEFDDMKNGVNMVVEFELDVGEEEPKRIALSVDVKMSVDAEIIDEKMESNWNKIKNRTYSVVKYYESPSTGEKGQIREVIPVAVALGGENAINFLTKFAQTLRKKEKTGSAERVEMEKHPAQKIFLNEILLQLYSYLTIIEADKQPRDKKAIVQITEIIDELNNLLDEKSDIDSGGLEDDIAYAHIRKITDKWRGRK